MGSLFRVLDIRIEACTVAGLPGYLFNIRALCGMACTVAGLPGCLFDTPCKHQDFGWTGLLDSTASDISFRCMGLAWFNRISCPLGKNVDWSTR